MSDGDSDLYDEGFDIRDGQAELADDLEALVQSIATGDIPDWKDAPELATDLVLWITHQEVPHRRKPARLALDLSILLGDSRISENPPLLDRTQMADILRIVKEAAEHAEHAEEHAVIKGNAFGIVRADLFQTGGHNTDTSGGGTFGSAIDHLPAGLLIGLSYPSNHRGKGKGGGSGSTSSTRLPHAPLAPHDVSTSGSACQPFEIKKGPVGHNRCPGERTTSGLPTIIDQDDDSGAPLIEARRKWRGGTLLHTRASRAARCLIGIRCNRQISSL